MFPLGKSSSYELASNRCSPSPTQKQTSCEHRTIRPELVPCDTLPTLNETTAPGRERQHEIRADGRRRVAEMGCGS